jgi:hypothetical protein
LHFCAVIFFESHLHLCGLINRMNQIDHFRLDAGGGG